MIAVSLVSSALSAQPVPVVAAAETLFQEGVALQNAGRLEEACAKLDESFKLDPAGSTAFALGSCLESRGQIASAWARYQSALQYALRRNRPDKVSEVRTKIDSLSPRLPRIDLRVDPQTAALVGVKITVGGFEQGRASWGSVLPMDPGAIEVDASAPGYLPWHGSFSLVERETTTVLVPQLVNEPSPASSAPIATALGPAPLSSAGDSSPRPVGARMAPSQRSVRETAGLLTAGAGLVALGAGSVLAVLATQKAGAAQRACFPTCVQGGGAVIYDEARSLRTGSIVAFSAGAALFSSGLVLYFMAPNHGRRAASPSTLARLSLAGQSGVALTLEGAWP